jgi:two-component system NarL family response regulator
MRVLIVDDHPLFADGLRNLLSARGVEVVGVARDGLEALEKARALRPEVILMDIQMPRLDGLAATRLVRGELPDTIVVMLTQSAEDEHLFEALKGGASGYLLKSEPTEEFMKLLQGVTRGEVALSPGLAGRVLKELASRTDVHRADVEAGARSSAERAEIEPLTERQLEVLRLVAKGLLYKEVGAQLGLSERAIKYHMGEIVTRLHLESRAQALDYARRSGLIPRG